MPPRNNKRYTNNKHNINNRRKTYNRNVYIAKPEAKRRRPSEEDDGHEDRKSDAGGLCAICGEPYNSQDHKVVSLKCGHVFGYKCIEPILRKRRAAERLCPICKQRNNKTDMVPIYPRCINVDESEIKVLQAQVQELQEELEKNKKILESQRTLLDELSLYKAKNGGH